MDHLSSQQNINSQPHAIHFSGPINPITVNNLRSALLPAIRQNATEIKLYFSSEGGDLNSGLALYHFLRAYPIPLTIVNFGSVESIAVLIFLAADKRLVVEHGRFLIHSFNANFQFQSVDHGRLSERTRSIDSYAEIYTKIFKERTNSAQTPIDVGNILHGDALIIDSATAISAGIATSIISAEGAMTVNDIPWWVAP